MTPENVRFHAAGHLAAAALLVQAGDNEGARVVLQAVEAYIQHPKVICPPAIKRVVSDCIENPKFSKTAITQLEEWFVDPLNSKIEGAVSG